MSFFVQLLATAAAITATALLPYVGAFFSGWVVASFYAASVALSTWDRRNEMRKAQRAALDSYNASLKDRLETVDLTPDMARTLVMGTVRGCEGVRRRWVSGDNDEVLTLVISYAGHEIDAFEAFYVDDTEVTLDGDGYVQEEPWAKGTRDTQQLEAVLNGSGAATIPLGGLVPLTGTLRGVYQGGTPTDPIVGVLTCTLDGLGNVLVSGGVAGTIGFVVFETVSPTAQKMRIRTWLGAAGQNVGADLAAEYPGKITSADKFAGMAVAVVDLHYDPDVFPTGRPNITARLRGAKVYDPRLDSTQSGGSGAQRLADASTWAWSANPMLHAYHYARHANGWGVPAAQINVADVMAGADVCDQSTSFTLHMADASTSTVTLPRYRCGIVIPTDGDPAASMEDIMQAMAGRYGWAGGILRMRPGHKRTASFALDPSWIAQTLGEDGEPSTEPVVRVLKGTPREQRINRFSGTCVNPDERWQPLPFPPIEDAVLIARDGAVYQQDDEMRGVNHPAHAQHLGSIAIRGTQASLRLQPRCNLSAYRCELLDVGTVTLPRFGFDAITMEVIGWSWHPTQGVLLTLAEITDAMFTPVDTLVGLDPAPDSTLRRPWYVPQVTGVQISSGITALDDGSVMTRTLVTWDAVTQQSIAVGGKIEVQYWPFGDDLPDGEWTSWEEQGSATQAVIPGLLAGRYYLFRVRAVQSLPLVRGPWSALETADIGTVPSVAGATFVVEFSDAEGISYSNIT